MWETTIILSTLVLKGAVITVRRAILGLRGSTLSFFAPAASLLQIASWVYMSYPSHIPDFEFRLFLPVLHIQPCLLPTCPVNPCQTLCIALRCPVNPCQTLCIALRCPVNPCQTLCIALRCPANPCQTLCIALRCPVNPCQTLCIALRCPVNPCQTLGIALETMKPALQ